MLLVQEGGRSTLVASPSAVAVGKTDDDERLLSSETLEDIDAHLGAPGISPDDALAYVSLFLAWARAAGSRTSAGRLRLYIC